MRLLGADGREMLPAEFMEAARRDGLLAHLDALKLPRVARVARKVQERGRASVVLSTFAGESLADDGFRAAAADAAADTGSDRLVLSFAQSDVRGFGPIHWQALTMLADWGLRFALEEVLDLDMDFEVLRARGFDFIKLDAQVFLEGMPSAGGLVPSADLCRYLSELGLILIVGRIDDERALARILGYGVAFGQGALFGGPKPVRADVVGATPRAA